ncbi:MAG TPA: DUF4157 domain-containing protein [Actinomycetota bacterium]
MGRDDRQAGVMSARMHATVERPVAVSRPHDPAEREAERAADVVASGGRVGAWSFSSLPLTPPSDGEPPFVIHRAASGESAVDAESIARDAVHSQGHPLDSETRGMLDERFGYDFSRVRLHDGPRAAAGTAALGALAFTFGNDIALGAGAGSTADGGLRLLAHELAHVVQQDRARSARPVVQRYASYSPQQQTAGSSGGWRHPTGRPIRISDDGQIAVEDNGWDEGRNKRAWTTPTLLASAHGTLSAQGSRLNLRAKGGGVTVAGAAPRGGAPSSLTEIEPFNPAGGALNMVADCGDTCRSIMGSGGRDVASLTRPARPARSGSVGGAIGGALGGLALGGLLGAGAGFLAGGVMGAVIGGIIGGIAGAVALGYAGWRSGRREAQRPREEYLSPRDYHGGNPTTPEEWTEELLRREFGAGLTRAQLYARYAAMSSGDREEFDRRHGINQFARPHLGQGVTMSTEKDMPGFVPPTGRGWNFHYAATVLESGVDYVTLETAAGWNPSNWIFYMYGERSGQSFHEEHAATGEFGSHHMTYVVQPESRLDVTTVGATTMRAGATTVTLDAGTALRIVERRPNGELLVRVASGPHSGTTGVVSAGDVR